MKRKMIIILVLGFFILPIQKSWAATTLSGNLNLFLGQKWLDSDDWEDQSFNYDATEQGEAGLLFDFRPTDWPFNIAIDLWGSRDEQDIGGLEIESSTGEFGFGVRKYFMEETAISPFLGAGLANVSAELRLNNIGVSESDLGYWLMAGLVFHPIEKLNLGMTYRYSKATPDFGGTSVEAGGTHLGLLIGFNF